MKTDTYKVYQLYNSLFLNLYYQNSNSVGHLIPILSQYSAGKLSEGASPVDILDKFYLDYSDVVKDDLISFMFRVIQYVERQVVLFDSIEDVASPYALEDNAVLQIHDLLHSGIADRRQQLIEKLDGFSVRIVLTAHPTQFYRPPVLDIIAKLRKQIARNNIEGVDTLLHQLGLTSLINTESPTPFDEALNILHICRYAYYDAIGDFYYRLRREIPGIDNPGIITLGFWPCGDRDGNPNVTHETTRQVIDALRMTLMKCYYKDLKALGAKLTFKGVESRLQAIRDRVYVAMFQPETVVDHRELLAALHAIKEKLINEFEGIYIDDLEKVIAKVQVFQSHFASLDIRQDHSVHLDTVQFLLKQAGHIKESISELTEEQLIELLTEGRVAIPEELPMEGAVSDTIRNIGQLPELQRMNGERGCHRYIISNSEDIFSVLFVFGLFRWIHAAEPLRFDIVPLFETMQGMSECGAVMERLFSDAPYNAYLKRRGMVQTMMLGFSDGTKDGGYLKANWSIFKSKEALTHVCRRHGVEAVFFDGRGGPPARGGGKTHNFYAALGPDIANKEIQLTIQGQTITSKYGTADKFIFNAEQMISSGMLNHVHGTDASLSEQVRERIEALSELSYIKYAALKEHPAFLPYLEKMTTLKYYSDAKIGSRPSKRNRDKKLTLKDLRAISYVGSWSQLKQNIPGYYGVGTALSQVKAQGRLPEFQALYREVPFFRTLIDNCMMSLTKCYFELTSYMKQHEEFGDFWQMLYDEFRLSKAMVLEVTGTIELMQDEQSTRRSIATREAIVLPLIVIQNYALQMISSGKDPGNHALYEKLISRSLYGNINASRNSA